MIAVLTPEQMHNADRAAFARLGESALMRNAGRPGRSGGASLRRRQVASLRLPVPAIMAATPLPHVRRSGEVLRRERASSMRLKSAISPPRVEMQKTTPKPKAWSGDRCRTMRTKLQRRWRDAGLALDGLFGTSSRLPIGDPYRAIIRALNASDCADDCDRHSERHRCAERHHR